MKSAGSNNESNEFLPDEEIQSNVKFGFDDYSEALASIVADKNLQTPFTIAIHGEWGSGKTSLMRTIIKKLELTTKEQAKVKSIWFNAWEFEKLTAPLWTVFLNRIVLNLQESAVDAGIKSKCDKIGRGIISISAEVILRKVADISLSDAKQNLEENVLNDIKKIDSLRENLQGMIEAALEKDPDGKERLAIFIDDVDRCLPSQAVEIFETIKLFLNCKYCVFILGVDKDQIRKAFEYKFGNKEGPSGLLYVEKFVQLQFDLPRKTPIEVSDFLKEHASEQLKKSPKTIELISRFIEPNPRKIKRWINSLLFLERLFKIKQEKLFVGSEEIDVSIVSIWLFLKSFFPDFASCIESDLMLLNTAIRVASGQGTDEDKKRIGDFKIDKRLAEFLSLLKPEYSEKQLRDVVYLSKLTPPQQISILPADIVRRIASLSKAELENQITSLSEESALSLCDKIVDNLSNVTTFNEYQNALNLYELIDILFENTKDSIKIQLFDRILAFSTKSSFASAFFLTKLEGYTKITSIKQMVANRGLLDKIIEIFVNSNSYEESTKISGIILNFNELLTTKQLGALLKASIENNQIVYSWGAIANLSTIFSDQKEKLSNEQVAELMEKSRITLS